MKSKNKVKNREDISESTIEVAVRDVDNTLGFFQHIFIIHTDSKGEKTVLRGGPGVGGFLLGDLKVEKALYEVVNSKKPVDWQENPQRIVIAKGTDAKTSALVDKMWARGQEINKGGYDYKLPIGHVQNSNTAVAEMVRASGLELKLPRNKDGSFVNVPGVETYIYHTDTDQFLQENACDFMGGNCEKYREKVKEKFKQAIDKVFEDLSSSATQPKPDNIKGLQGFFRDTEETGVLQKDISNKQKFEELAKRTQDPDLAGTYKSV